MQIKAQSATLMVISSMLCQTITALIISLLYLLNAMPRCDCPYYNTTV